VICEYRAMTMMLSSILRRHRACFERHADDAERWKVRAVTTCQVLVFVGAAADPISHV